MKTYFGELHDRRDIITLQQEIFLLEQKLSGVRQKKLPKIVAQAINTGLLPRVILGDGGRGGDFMLLLQGEVPADALDVQAVIVTAEEQAAAISYSSAPLEDYIEAGIALSKKYDVGEYVRPRLFLKASRLLIERVGPLPLIEDGQQPDWDVLNRIDACIPSLPFPGSYS